MKNLIITIGILILAFNLIIFQTDVNKLRRDVSKVEEATNEVLSSTLSINNYGFREGILIYDVNSVEEIINIFEVNIPESVDYEIIMEFRGDEGSSWIKVKKGGTIYKDELDLNAKTLYLTLKATAKPFTLDFLEKREIEIVIEREGALISH